MKRFIAAVAFALLCCVAVSANAGPAHSSGGLGFHSVDAPIGVRLWVSEKLALDAGFGVGSQDDPAIDQHLSHWALDLGVPILLKSFDQLHFILRPGVMLRSQEVVLDPGPPVETDHSTSTSFGAELEAEYFFTNDFSVSAAHGFEIVNNNPAVGQSTSDWGTTGSNFTNVGFHVYVFGSK